MYCPNCEIEIKGEGQTECPICNSSLIENPFEDITRKELTDEEDIKLKELIEDIDEKVSKNLSEIAEDAELQGGEPSFKEEEPSESEFKLELEEELEVTPMEEKEKLAFELSQDEEAEPEAQPEEPGEQIPHEAEHQEAAEQPPVQEETGFDLEKELGGAGVVTTHAPADEAVDVPEEIKEHLSTKALLDRALDELDALDEEKPIPRKTSTTRPLAVAIIALVAVICGAYFVVYKSDMLKEAPTPAETVVKKEERIIKKAVKRDTAQKEKEPPAVRQEPAAAPVVARAPESTGPTQKAAKPTTAPEEKPVVEKAVEVPGAVEPPETAVAAKKPSKTAAPVAKDTVKPVVAAPPAVTYAIHAGSYRKRISADGEVRRFKDKGFDAYVDKTDLGTKGSWYRVKIGSYSSIEEARKAQSKFRSVFRKDDSRIIKNKP